MTLREMESRSPHDGLYDVRSQLQTFVYKRSEEAFAAADAARDAIGTPEELAGRQGWIRERFIECLGGLPESGTPLNARSVGTVECEGFRIEKVIFESRPGVFVTANLYLPEGIGERRGAVLFVCGHHDQAKHQPEYQSVCQQLVRAGLVVLAQDPVGQGERYSYYEPALGGATVNPGTGEHDYAGSQCAPLGDTIGRYFVHDSMRAIDYLCSRPEVDPARIGVTGNSGGGTQTAMMMLCDPRVAAAAPATFIMSRQQWVVSGGAQDAEQVWPAAGVVFDHEDILLAMAPKPVLVLAVTYDFFQIEGTRRTVARARRLWELCGKGEQLELVEEVSDHRYTPALARAAAEFFSRHLLGAKEAPGEAVIETLPPSRLWCTRSGQVRGEIAGARFVHEENCDRLAEMARARASRPEGERKRAALSWLRERVFFDRRRCELNPRPYSAGQAEELSAEWWMWWSQQGLLGSAVVLRHFERAGESLPVTLAIWPEGTNNLHGHERWIRETCRGGRAVVALDTSGVGALTPHPMREGADAAHVSRVLQDDLVWIGDSLAALRTYDVIRAVEAMALIPGLRSDDLRVHGEGRYAIYGQFAAALDGRIASIEVVDGMGSYAEWVGARHYDSHDIRSVILPGVLRHFDLPELERWIAERS
ncbi:MAG: alpha/beta hydrolase family protein [Armatimonadota bacterium]